MIATLLKLPLLLILLCFQDLIKIFLDLFFCFLAQLFIGKNHLKQLCISRKKLTFSLWVKVIILNNVGFFLISSVFVILIGILMPENSKTLDSQNYLLPPSMFFIVNVINGCIISVYSYMFQKKMGLESRAIFYNSILLGLCTPQWLFIIFTARDFF